MDDPYHLIALAIIIGCGAWLCNIWTLRAAGIERKKETKFILEMSFTNTSKWRES